MSRKRGKERVHAFASDNDDEYSDYSEDFENDSPSSTPDHNHSNIRNKTRLLDKHDLGDLSSSSITTTTTTRSAKKSTQSEGRRRPPKQSGYGKHGWRSNSFTKDSKKKFSMKDSVQSRMLSAKRHRINTLNNELCETQLKLEELVKENRFLKTLQHRQDRALRKFEDEESDLPRLISQHSEEQRVLKARLRKSQDAERQLEKKLRETNEEMQKMENVLRRLKKMVYDKNLGERSELTRQLSVAETRLEDAERKNKELNKKLELTTNSFTRQINAERAKHRDTKETLDILKDDHLILQAKLKEKERALEVSNIYALRVKQSPEKSFVGGKVALISPRQVEKHSTPKAETPPKANKRPLAIQESPEPEKPAPVAVKTVNEPTDFRKTVRSPHLEPSDRENSALLDLATTPKEQDVTKGLNGLRLHEKTPKVEDKGREDPKRQSVFLTANFESPFTTPSHTFIEDKKKAKSVSPPNQQVLQDSLSGSPPAYAPTNETRLPDLQEAKRKERQEELARQKEEEERRRKADLLAKLRDLEEDNTKPPLGDIKPAVNGVGVRKLLSNGTHGNKVLLKQDRVNPNDPKGSRSAESSPKRDGRKDDIAVCKSDSGPVSLENESKSQAKVSVRSSRKLYTFPQEVENLHMGVPSALDGDKSTKKSSKDVNETDFSFGGYAPSLGAQPKRKAKGRTQLPVKPAHSKSSESESDEPLLDLTSGKAKKSDLLSQLFGDQATKQTSSVAPPNGVKPQTMAKEKPAEPKPMPRAKPIHSGYPWEQNVRAAPTGDKGNGDAGHTFATPIVKPVTSSFNDDDIEEMTL